MGFEPINGPGGAIVQDSAPVVDPGRVWFDTSPSDGVDVKLADDTGWTLVGTIPDDQVTSFDYSDAGFGQLANFDPLGELSQQAFVDILSPEHEPGRIWFDPSPSTGIDVHVANDTGWTLVGQIPYRSEIAPFAEFSSSPTNPTTDDTVSFSAGDYQNVSSYTIDYKDDRELTDRTDISSIPSHTFSSAENYEPELTVENEHGMTVSYTTSVNVLQPAYFDVTGVSTNSPVKTGNDVEVTVTVKNTGEVEGTKSVSVDAGGLGSKSTNLTINGNSSTASHTFSFSTNDSDAGSYSPTASTDDDSMSGSVTVAEEPTASFSYSGTTEVDSSISFDASGSSNANSYDWDWTNDGTDDATGSTASHTYSSSGSKTVKLTASNDYFSDSTTQTLSIDSGATFDTIDNAAVWTYYGYGYVGVEFDVTNNSNSSATETVTVTTKYTGDKDATTVTSSRDITIDANSTEDFMVNHDHMWGYFDSAEVTTSDATWSTETSDSAADNDDGEYDYNNEWSAP